MEEEGAGVQEEEVQVEEAQVEGAHHGVDLQAEPADLPVQDITQETKDVVVVLEVLDLG